MSGRHRSLGNIHDTRGPSSTAGTTRKMTSAGIAEEAALLGTAPSDTLDDIELRNIRARCAAKRSMSRDLSAADEEYVETDHGKILVAIEGPKNKTPIITYHDIGLNYISNFQAFFNYVDMQSLLQNFCVYHINAPGQEEGAETLPTNYVFPTMDELAAQIDVVVNHYNIKQFIGFGVGAGANILVRYALKNPDKVIALCLVNCISTHAGWIEWSYKKFNSKQLRSKGVMTQSAMEYLLWHHFGRDTESRNRDVVQMYKEYFERNMNPTNLALFLDAYANRTDLNIHRDTADPTKKKEGGTTLKMAVINITGARCPYADDTVVFNGRLNPSLSSWMKISDCGMVVEEQPGKLSEAFRLFLQGEGYALQVRRQSSISLEGKPFNVACS